MGLADKLRDEIIESQKAQTDLVKWKLILVAAIGATGLRAVPDTPANAPILLALIPLVCIYVDAVCFHCEIRIMSIARFLRFSTEPGLKEDRVYEEHCENHRTHFALISVALLGASVVLSFLVFLSGALPGMRQIFAIPDDDLIRIALAVTGGVGTIGSLVFYRFCQNRTRWLDKAPYGDPVPPVWRFFLSLRRTDVRGEGC
jgi:hypothetical protein